MMLSLLITATLALPLPGSVSPAGASEVAEARLLRTPDIQDETLAFSYAGDIWISEVGSSAPARRLTSLPGQELWPRISPDGRWVAFSSSQHGRLQLYIVPLTGGEPKRLTYGAPAEPLCWTPGGKIAYRSGEGNWTQSDRLWLIGPGGWLPTWTPIAEVGEASFFADGRMAYNRSLYRQYLGLRHYDGGAQGRISLYDFAANKYEEIRSDGGAYSPMAVGKSIYFVSDKGRSRQNLYRYDFHKKQETRLTSFGDADIRWPRTDGERIVWERDGYLEVYDLASARVSRQNPCLPVEEVKPKPSVRKMEGEIAHLSLSPNGHDLLFEAHGEIFFKPVSGGQAQNLTSSSGARDRLPTWSPDGRSAAYLSDSTGEWDVFLWSAANRTATQLTSGKGIPFHKLKWSRDGKLLQLRTLTNELYVLDIASRKLARVPAPKGQLASSDWSADSRWLVFTYGLIEDTPVPLGSTPLGSLYFYEVSTGRLEQVTSGYYDSQLAFDANGKYLYVRSARTLNPGFGTFEYSLSVSKAQRVYVIPLTADLPNPFSSIGHLEGRRAHTRIEFPGLLDRMLPLPMPAGDYMALFGADNGVFYTSREDGRAGVTLSFFEFKTLKSQTIFSSDLNLVAGISSALSFSSDRSRVAVMTPEGPSVIDVKPDADPKAGLIDLKNLSVTLDPLKEWRQIFWEGWRFQRDTYFDSRMNGVDWSAVGRHYAGYLPSLTSRADLSYVLLQMIGALGTSHSFVSPPPDTPAVPDSPGYLGADYEAVNGFVRFKKICRGQNFDESRRGPLGEPGVRVSEGDYLLAIDGEQLTAKINPGSLLLNKAGKDVELTINSRPTLDGATKIIVKPIADEGALRYVEWTEANRKYVLKKSGGRIGYIHIPDTWTGGATELIRGFYGQLHLDALLIDERNNLGGLAQPFIVPTLARKSFIGSYQRNGPDWLDTYAHEGPKAMLINEHSGSGGDILPWMFKRAGLGALIGRRTAGLFTGYFERLAFVDGGTISAAQLGYRDPRTGKQAPENYGTAPDIEIDLRPDLLAKGQDPQLDAGISHLMDQLRKWPGKPVREGSETSGRRTKL